MAVRKSELIAMLLKLKWWDFPPEELLRFLESAFTFDASEIVHKTQGREPSAPQHV